MNLTLLAAFVFYLSALALGYTYAGYPIVVFLASRIFPRRVKRGAFEPMVSGIITAYNEERDIREKLENTLALDYPPELVEVIVASDCSSDRTDEVVREFELRGVRLLRQPVRMGKTAAQNAAVEVAQGEIILFSDATTVYAKDALRSLLPSFADNSVGCVAGRLVYVDPSMSGVGRGARSYWGYETFIKRCESQVSSLIGASGCLYAVRRSAYVPMYNEACSDFLIATTMVEQNLRAIFEPDAICTEETNRRSDRELRMRVRVITQTLNDLWRHRSAMNPLNTGFYAIQLFSHKLLRYFVPFFLFAFIAATAVLAVSSKVAAWLLVLQFGFFILACIGFLLEKLGQRLGPASLPFYFCLANVACCIAVFHFLKGERYASWEPIRGEDSSLSPIPNGTRVSSVEGE
jgi:cellulose synthase/poly-beta-1,6-N-acetylglucosamine synthase-like glycosyltransferase